MNTQTLVNIAKNVTPEKVGQASKGLVAYSLEKLWNYHPEAFYNFSHDVLFAPRPMKMKERWASLLREARREDLYVPETEGHVATYRFGKGPAVILVHGWAARGMQLSDFVVPLTKRGFSVVVYDQPAHGESGLRSTNIFKFVFSLKRVIEQEREVAVLVGHSMGCSAISANLQWFPWIDKVALMAPHANLESEMMGWITSRGLTHQMVRSLVDWLEARYQLSFSKINLDQVASEIRSDVLLIHDEDDEATEYKNSALLERLIPSAELFSTQGLGHFRMVRDPLIRDRIVNWISS